jgi:hypothetical protein
LAHAWSDAFAFAGIQAVVASGRALLQTVCLRRIRDTANDNAAVNRGRTDTVRIREGVDVAGKDRFEISVELREHVYRR